MKKETMRLKQFNEEVLYTDDQIVKVRRLDIELLKERANQNRRKRIRLCAHKDINETLHEMLIIHTKDTYVRPHKHLNKIESFHIIEGSVDVAVFNDMGEIIDVIIMGEYLSNNNFYYRISDSIYHTLLIKSDILVFHEVTNGPFEKSKTIFAPWAPDESENTSQGFVTSLRKRADIYLALSSANGGAKS